MAQRTNNALDDRGRPVWYRDPMFHGSELGAGEQRAMSPGYSRRWGIVINVLVILVLASQALRLVGRQPAVVIGAVVWTGGFFALIWWVVLPPLRRKMWNVQWKSRYLSIGRCPACQYSIAGIDREEDGCTVCPECGGAWRCPA